MAPASLQLILFEPVVFLRGQSAVGEDARGRRRPINIDAPPSQLRGLLTLTLPKPSKIKEVSILLQGRARTDWPEGIGPNRLDTSEESIIFSQKIILYSAKDAQHGQTRRRSSSVGNIAEETKDDRKQMDRSFSTHSAYSSSSLPKGDRLADGERSPTLVRSLGHAAARAGTAILPPTLVRELNASKQASTPSSYNSVSASSSPMRSPTSLRTGPTRALSNQSTSDYFDPPPVYGPSQSSNHLSSSSHSSTPASDSSPISTSAAQVGDWLINTQEASSSNSIVQHPQSISAAGPSNRSILHPPGRQEGRQSSNTISGAGVRFDPGAISAGVHQQQGFGNAVVSPLGVQNLLSEPSSTRTSSEHSRSPSGQHSSIKGKGKAAANSSPSPGAGNKKGIKGLLSNLLKEDEEAQRNSKSSNSTSYEGSTLTQDDEAGNEFRKGTYTYPFSVPLPSNLPPTLHTDFGSNAYLVRAHVHREGSLTSNLTCDKEITLVHAPDEDGQNDNDVIVVERNWDDCLRYVIVVMGKSFPVGSKIPIWVKFVPTEKVRIHRIIASLEERTAYFAKGRRVARHEVPRRWNLLKLLPLESIENGILPIISDASNALLDSPVTPFAKAAAHYYSSESMNTTDINSDIISSLMDPFGPWELALDLEVPTCNGTIINISTNHKKSNIAVSHLVKLAIRVERLRGDGGERKLFDILIEAPVTINHSHTANAWLSLPDYWSVRDQNQVVATTNPSASNGAQTSSLTSLRRSTAPSLTPGRSLGLSRAESVNATRPISPPLQGRVNNNLIQLSQQWLSLSANSDGITTGSSSTVIPMTMAQEEGRYQDCQQSGDGLPTYAMIDGARGSVDLAERNNMTSVK